MGISYRVYLGPYLETRLCKQEVDREYLSCVNDKCDKNKKRRIWYDQRKFCSSCGSPIQKIEVKEWDYLPFNWKLKEEYGDALYDDLYNYLWVAPTEAMDYEHFPYNIWLPNQKLNGISRELSFAPRGDLTCTEITPDMMDKEIEAFESTFDKKLKIIVSWYGEENTKVKWGLVNYAM